MRRAEGVPELLDGPLAPDALAGNFRDLARANRWLGGVALSRRALVYLLTAGGSHRNASLLDIGTGAGDIPAALAEWLAPRGVALSAHGIDTREEILVVARERMGDCVTLGSGEQLPFDPDTFDVAHLSLVIHHLERDAARRTLLEAARVSRLGVIVNDLDRTRRSWLGAWLLSRTVTRNPYTRHDASLSVRRAYHPDEVTDLAATSGLREVGRWWDPWRHRYALALVDASDDRSLPATAGPGRYARSRRRSRPGGGNHPDG